MLVGYLVGEMASHDISEDASLHLSVPFDAHCCQLCLMLAGCPMFAAIYREVS